MTNGAESVAEISRGLASFVAELFVQSRAARYGVSREQFGAILEEIGSKYLPSGAGQEAWRLLYSSLRLEDLVLARACAAGNELAWESFLLRYREKLYDIAGYIAKESSAARELADGIYADLYGTVTPQGERVCKLNSYTGRGSLEGWLRAVMSQEFINRYRKQRRLVSLDGEAEDGQQFAAQDLQPEVAVDSRVETAADEALAALGAEERYLLASYYLDGRTLAEIAATLAVHESTVSRKLDKLAKSLRKQIIASLASRGMSRRQAEEAMEVDVRDLRVDIRSQLMQKGDPPTFPKKNVPSPGSEGVS